MQPELAVDRADLRRLDQPRMGHGHRVQRAFELLEPEVEELVQFRKYRAQVVALPDIALQEPGVVRPPVQDVRRRQSVAFELFAKVFRYQALGNHRCPPSRSWDVPRLAPPLQASCLNKLFTFKALAASLRPC